MHAPYTLYNNNMHYDVRAESSVLLVRKIGPRVQFHFDMARGVKGPVWIRTTSGMTALLDEVVTRFTDKVKVLKDKGYSHVAIINLTALEVYDVLRDVYNLILDWEHAGNGCFFF